MKKILWSAVIAVLLLASSSLVSAQTTAVAGCAPGAVFSSTDGLPCPTVTTIPTSVCTNLTTNMTVGSTDKATGGQVTKLQLFLQAQGHLAPQASYGYFGSLTKAALAQYQVSNGISPADGYAGPVTRAYIQAKSCGIAAADMPTSVKVVGTPTLKLTYDSKKKESALTGTGVINIKAGSEDVLMSPNIGFGLTREGDPITPPYGLVPGDSEYKLKAPSGMKKETVNDEHGNEMWVYRIKAGTTAEFQQTLITSPADMFKGVYTVKFFNVGFLSKGKYTQLSVEGPESNKVAIEGARYAPATEIKVTSPKKGDVITEGSNYTVTWKKIAGDFDRYDVLLANDMVPGLRIKTPGGAEVPKEKNSVTLDGSALNPAVVSFKNNQGDGLVTEDVLRKNFRFIVQAIKELPNEKSQIVAEGESGSFSILPALNNDIEVTNPIGGEILKAGDKFTIKWKGPKNHNFDIDLIDENGSLQGIIARSLKGFSYVWKVGEAYTENSAGRSYITPVANKNYKIHVHSEEMSSSRFSGAFTINTASLDARFVTAHATATTIQKGTNQTAYFTWETNVGDGREVNFALVHETTGATYPIKRGVLNDKKGNISASLLDGVPAGRYKVKVAIVDVKGANYSSITPEVITVTAASKVSSGPTTNPVTSPTTIVPSVTSTTNTTQTTTVTPVAKSVTVSASSGTLVKGSKQSINFTWNTNINGGTANISLKDVKSGENFTIKQGVTNDGKEGISGENVKGIPVGPYQIRVVITANGVKYSASSDAVLQVLAANTSSAELKAAKNQASVIDAIINLLK
jgi:hypothetical protein